jgi:UDP:flavonoid glycosyltransferase YjiC (YdhE family)
VTVYPFVPYARDLGRFDAVIHHGGAGVTYAAILCGVPAVVVPHDYDQFDYAARVEFYGCGVRAGSVRGAGGALRAVLEKKAWPELERMREAALTYRPGERFLELVRGLVK